MSEAWARRIEASVIRGLPHNQLLNWLLGMLDNIQSHAPPQTYIKVLIGLANAVNERLARIYYLDVVREEEDDEV